MNEPTSLLGCAGTEPCVEVTARLTATDIARSAGVDDRQLREIAARFAQVHRAEQEMRRAR